MSMLIYMTVAKIVVTIECAPKLGEIFQDENKTLENIIPHKDDIPDFKEQVKLTQRNIDFKQNLKLDVIQSDNITLKPHTEVQFPNILSKENDISDNDSSSDWLDPELDALKTASRSQTKPTFLEKTECNICSNVDLFKSADNDTVALKEQISNDSTETDPLYDETIKIKATTKRETQPSLIKLLRSIGNSEQININQEVNIEGYNYNFNICRYRGNRYLCGYNKNIGNVKDSLEIEDIGNGCIIRGDRMECGYQIGQFDDKISKLTQKYIPEKMKTDYNTQSTQQVKSVPEKVTPLNSIPVINSTNRTNQTKTKQTCYEQDNRVVCYDIPV